MADDSTARNSVRLILLFSTIIFCTQAFPLWSADSRRITTVPALGVLANGQTDTVHYIVLQLDRDPRREGPTVQFNEINLGGGSIVGEDWKEGVKQDASGSLRTRLH